MGVVGTFCQVCGLPVQHDHYVPMDGMFGIFRGGEGHEVCAPAVAFGPEHAWLKDAVGLRLRDGPGEPVIRGRVHDGRFEGPGGGSLEDGFVWDGLDERAALHAACWERAGRPGSWAALGRVRPSPELRPYQEQLFDFARLVADGLGWMLVDPDADSPDGRRSAARILARLGQG